jgi:hypothetical protein
MGVTEEEPS